MSSKSIDNSNTNIKKCGEVIIAIKKDAKNVYSFNCWFCGTIYVQMKKFTLHIEKEHITQLEKITSVNSEHGNKCNFREKTNTQEGGSTINNIFVGEIKVEDFDNDIKSKMREEMPQITQREHLCQTQVLQDPLEEHDNEIALSRSQQNKGINEVEVNKDIDVKNESIFDDEMKTFSDDYDEDNLENDSDSSDDGKTYDSDNEIENSSGKKCRKLLKEKKLIMALIDAYLERPQLWDPTLAKDSSVKQRKGLFQSITDDLNAKLHLNLKYHTVKKKLNFLCKQFEKEFRKKNRGAKNYNEKGCSELWFYENMSFLKSTVESNLKQKRKKIKAKPLSEDLLCKIIDIYKYYNSLWDVNNIAYTVKQKRNETMQSMVDDIKTKMNLSLNLDKLKANLQFIHNSFAKDKQYKLECEAKQLDFEPKCPYFKICDFLEAHQAPFKCQYCSEILMTYKTFQIHKSEHDGSMPFMCQECGTGFKSSGNYTLHVKRHLRVFRFRCEICDKGYPINYELELHMRSHTGALPYLCSVCGEGFRTANIYDNHMRRHEERFRYSCHICKKGFNILATFNDHVKAHLNVRDVICTICGKGFTSRKYLNYHKRIHGAKNYTCNICGKSYAQDAGLRQHKKSHGTPIGISK